MTSDAFAAYLIAILAALKEPTGLLAALAAERAVHDRVPDLGVAWAEAEAALPEGAAMVRLTWRIGMHEKFPPDQDFEARAEWWAGNDRLNESAFGPTPAAALRALAALTASEPPSDPACPWCQRPTPHVQSEHFGPATLIGADEMPHPERAKSPSPERLARAMIRVRGAHNPAADELDGDQEVRPCAWCRLAAEQAIEAIRALTGDET